MSRTDASQNTSTRQLPNWIASFVSETKKTGSPEIWRIWTALSCISAVLRRQVWTVAWGEERYPNLYVLLVGPPGMGKSTCTRAAKAVTKGLKDFRIAAAMTTKEEFINQLANKAGKTEVSEDPFAGFVRTCSVHVFSDEFSVFLRPSDIEMMRVLTDVFDCPKLWEYSIRGRDQPDRADNVYVCVLGGTTPKDIAESFTAKLIGTGFFARFILPYAETRHELDPFEASSLPDYTKLNSDLAHISKLRGLYEFDPPAVAAFRAWLKDGMNPIPHDTRLAEYVTRRPTHWLKLCMLFAAAKRDDLLITLEDVEQSKALLLWTEEQMPLALEKAGTNPLKNQIEEAASWVVVASSTKGFVKEADLRYHLMRDIPIQFIGHAIESMVAIQKIRVVGGEPPNRLFSPIIGGPIE